MIMMVTVMVMMRRRIRRKKSSAVEGVKLMMAKMRFEIDMSMCVVTAMFDMAII